MTDSEGYLPPLTPQEEADLDAYWRARQENIRATVIAWGNAILPRERAEWLLRLATAAYETVNAPYDTSAGEASLYLKAEREMTAIADAFKPGYLDPI